MSNQNTIPIKINTAYIEDDKLYFSAWNVNGFFSYNFQSGNTKLINRIPGYEGKCGYSGLFKDKDNVYLAPCNGDAVVVIDKSNWTIDNYPIDKSIINRSYARYGEMFKKGNSLFLVPYSAPSIIEFDLFSNDISYYDECFRIISKVRDNRGPLFFGGVFHDNKIWFVGLQTNLVFSFDTNSKVTSRISINNINDSFINIYYAGDYFWILCESGKLYKWNETDGICNCFNLDSLKGYTYSSMCYFNGELWFVKPGFNGCITLNADSEIITEFAFERVDNDMDNKGVLRNIDNKLFYFSEGWIYEITNKKSIITKQIVLNDEEYDKYIYESIYSYDNAISEEDYPSLHTFIDAVKVGTLYENK